MILTFLVVCEKTVALEIHSTLPIHTGNSGAAFADYDDDKNCTSCESSQDETKKQKRAIVLLSNIQSRTKRIIKQKLYLRSMIKMI